MDQNYFVYQDYFMYQNYFLDQNYFGYLASGKNHEIETKKAIPD